MAEEYSETFKKGTIVEASSEDSGLRGSWYTATVIRTLSPKTNKLLIEYHNLSADNSGKKPLREFVDALLVRPIPPRDPPSRLFHVMDDVDAFHNDGWWEGVVTSVVSLSPTPVYSVFFRCSREQIDFTLSDLRLHREWVRGNHWLPPLSPCQDKKIGDNKGQRRNGNYSGDRDGVTRNGDMANAGRSNPSISHTQNGIAKTFNNKEKKKSANGLSKNISVNKKKEIKLRKVSNSNGNKLGVKRTGKLKEPRKRVASHAGRVQSKK